jgi:hypothetical protein
MVDVQPAVQGKGKELDEFSLVREHAKPMEKALLSEYMANCDHGEIEKYIFVEGRGLLRR